MHGHFFYVLSSNVKTWLQTLIFVHSLTFFWTGNIFISYNTNLEECQHSGDEGFDENDTPGPRKRTPIYKIGTLHLTLTKKLKREFTL